MYTAYVKEDSKGRKSSGVLSSGESVKIENVTTMVVEDFDDAHDASSWISAQLNK